MWRRHQAVQSTVQRWLGHYRTPVGLRKHFLSSSSVGRSSLYTAPFSASWPSILRSDVSHPSPITYGDVRLFSTRGGHRRPRIPMMRDLYSVEEVVVTAYDYLNLMSRRDVSAVWSRIPQLMTKRPQKQRAGEEFSIEDTRYMIKTIFDNTIDGIKDSRFREITETTLGMAKIVQILRKRAGRRRGEDAYRTILRELLLDKNNRTANRELFQFISKTSTDILDGSEARHISNLAYAYALIEFVPKLDDGSDLFDHIAMQSIEMKEFLPQHISNIVWAFATVEKRHDALFMAMGDQVVAHDHLREFRPQALSNIVWAYATAGFSHFKLFEKVANHIVRLDHLTDFNTQNLSNTVWAYATAGVTHPKIFEKLANHIAGLDNLRDFDPQALANIVWAYATAGISHPKLFAKLANHIIGLDHLGDFKPQNLSNIVWAYAKAGVNHPHLFKKVAKHIIQLDHLRDFNSQAIANIVWAYATAQVSHPELFKKVAEVATQCKEEFISQAVANLLWSYATMGIVDKQLFSSFAPIAAKLIDNYNKQDLSHVAWAYAIAGVDAPTLFNDHFIDECLEKKDGFTIEALSQLHQWHLWQTKEKSRTGLPEALQDRCYKAFISEEPTPSKLQDDVVGQLSSIGLDPKEEVLLDSGYRIDAIVEVNGKAIGVEVDGPFHFIGRSKSPLARTILKRRQVPLIEGIELVSVPYWEWDKPGKNQAKKQEYLRQLLGLDN